MEPSTSLNDTLAAIKNRVVVAKPYYNDDGFRANPPAVLHEGAYWPKPIPHDLPEVTYVENDHYE